MKNTKNYRRLFCTICFAFGTTLLAQQMSEDRAALLEFESDAYIPTPRSSLQTQTAYKATAPDYFTRQVNVNANGDDMIGDAANEPSIALDPTNGNRMVIGWRQFDNISSNFRQAGFGYTNDRGVSWTFPGVLDPGVFRSDPVLDVDANGNIYYNSLQSTFDCDVYTIPNGSFTAGAPVPARGGDKQWMHVDKSNSAGSGHNYSYWNTAFSTCQGAFTRSTDNANSFEECIDVIMDPFWGTLATNKNGVLYITGRNNIGNMVLISSNNAANANEAIIWDSVTTVDLDGQLSFFEPINPQGLSGQAWVVVDTSNGPGEDNIYILASVERNSVFDPADVMFTKSTDGGATFSPPVRINTDTGTDAYQWFGTLSIAPNGRLDVVWLDTRDAPVGTNDSVLYYSFSEDQGETWSENTAISESFDPNIGYPQQDKMGDYIEMVSDNEFAHLAWTATFNGGQDVYYTRILPDGVLSTLDITTNTNSVTVYPNPIDETTVISVTLDDTESASIALYDVLGKKVAVPFAKTITATTTIPFYGTDAEGKPLASGVYFLSVSIGNRKEVQQIIIK